MTNFENHCCSDTDGCRWGTLWLFGICQLPCKMRPKVWRALERDTCKMTQSPHRRGAWHGIHLFPDHYHHPRHGRIVILVDLLFFSQLFWTSSSSIILSHCVITYTKNGAFIRRDFQLTYFWSLWLIFTETIACKEEIFPQLLFS